MIPYRVRVLKLVSCEFDLQTILGFDIWLASLQAKDVMLQSWAPSHYDSCVIFRLYDACF